MVVRVQDHALPGAQGEDGLACVGERHAVAHLDAEGARGLRVPDRGAHALRVLQPEADPQDDEPVGVALEAAVPVGEAARLAGEGDDLLRTPVVRDDLGDRGGDLLAVRPDVLDGGGPAEPGMPARHSMPASPASTVRATASDQTSPAASSRQGAVEAEAARGDAQGGAVEALVADDQVGPAADQQQRRPGGVGLPYGGDDLVVRGGGEQPVGGAAEPERGQRGEGSVVEFLHAPSLRCGPRRRPRRPSRAVRAPRLHGCRRPAADGRLLAAGRRRMRERRRDGAGRLRRLGGSTAASGRGRTGARAYSPDVGRSAGDRRPWPAGGRVPAPRPSRTRRRPRSPSARPEVTEDLGRRVRRAGPPRGTCRVPSGHRSWR